MTAPALRPTGQDRAQLELLARLGLPASASPEDVDDLHQAVSEFLAAAPADIRGWARAQVAALDAAYLQLTDPVGLEGSALKSPASPPTVVPGGPATPPARRDPAPALRSVPAAAEAEAEATEDDDLGIDDEPGVEDLAALYAMVTPSAHEDMRPKARRAAPAPAPSATPTAGAARVAAATPAVPAGRGATGRVASRRVATRPAGASTVAATPAPAQPDIWKRLFLGVVGIVAVAGVLFGANALVNGGPSASPAASAPAAGNGAPAVDQAKVASLMEAYAANPEDVETLFALGDEFYAGELYAESAVWFDRLLAVDPEHREGLLARGAVHFNLGEVDLAKTTWLKLVALEPDNIRAHYSLGFLYLNQPQPDWAGVQSEWGKVVELDPSSKLAETVKAHLDSLAASSMLPGASGGASAAPSADPSAGPSAPAGSPAASPAASPAPSAAASAAPAASPAPSTVP